MLKFTIVYLFTMKHIKIWKTIKQGLYSLEIDSILIGTLEVVYSHLDRKALFTIESKIYTLHYTGFWKSNFVISDENDNVILTSRVEKWYANTTLLEYKGKQLQLKIRNNPLAEYVIFDGDYEILAYGLSTENRKATVRINTNSSENDYLLDFLLWYIFLPIAQENIGDNFTFHSLLLS
ncbi:MAG: hypothetical protein WCJ62_08695 [Flavobacterium sp.]